DVTCVAPRSNGHGTAMRAKPRFTRVGTVDERHSSARSTPVTSKPLPTFKLTAARNFPQLHSFSPRRKALDVARVEYDVFDRLIFVAEPRIELPCRGATIMKLNANQVEQVLTQIDVRVLPTGHPADVELNELFGDHTFFLDNSGVNILEVAETSDQG